MLMNCYDTVSVISYGITMQSSLNKVFTSCMGYFTWLEFANSAVPFHGIPLKLPNLESYLS